MDADWEMGCLAGHKRSQGISLLLGCNCDSEFTDGTCEDLTGRCYCKPNYTGERCDACAEGYIDFPHCYRKYISSSRDRQQGDGC